MTATTERRVAVASVGLQIQPRQHFVEKYRRVRLHAPPYSDSCSSSAGRSPGFVARLQPRLAALVPVRLVPELEPAALPDQHRLTCEPRVFAQLRRHQHPAVRVELEIGRVTDHQPLQPPRLSDSGSAAA